MSAMPAAIPQVAADGSSVLSEIMAAVPDCIVLCAADFSIRMLNRSACRMLQISEEEALGFRISDFMPEIEDSLRVLPDGEFVLDALWASPHQDANAAIEMHIPVEVRGHKGPVGENSDYILVFHDISTRLAAEEVRSELSQQLDEARRLEAIGALSSGIAHEINTPIQFIGDNMEFLGEALQQIYYALLHYEELRQAVAKASSFPEEVQKVSTFNASIGLTNLLPEIRQALKESREGITEVRDIILTMKEFAHPGTGDKDAADINILVGNVVNICRNRHKHLAGIDLDLDKRLPMIPCRKGQIQQVLLNIVMNALDSIEEAGRSDGRILIKTMVNYENIRITLSDNGTGIPDSLRAKIFDPFFTTKAVGKGTGQGLALAKDIIIKGHKGKLTVDDVEGFATTFVVELPINVDDATRITDGAEDVYAA